MSGKLKKSDQTQKSLLQRLKNWEDDASWRQFFDRYWRLIYSVAVRSGLNEAEAEDAVQETIISVAKTMPGFKYNPANCSFKTWLHHLAQKRITDQFRKRLPAALLAGGTSGTDPVASIPAPASVEMDAVWEHEWEEAIFDAALVKVRAHASADQFQIFDLYVLREWSVKKVMTTLGVSAAQVYLARHRILRLIRREIRRLEKTGI